MKCFLSLTVFMAGMALAEDGAALDQAWYGHYVAVQEALAADDFSKASEAAKRLYQNSQGDVRALAGKAKEAGDIQSLRLAFKPVSDHIKDRELPEGYVLAFCPMAFNDKGGHWVQKDGVVMNPYYGAYMLHCGAIMKKGGETEE